MVVGGGGIFVRVDSRALVCASAGFPSAAIDLSTGTFQRFCNSHFLTVLSFRIELTRECT